MIEHVKEDEKLISEIRRVLKSGGVVYLSTPNERYFDNSPKFPILLKKILPKSFRKYFGYLVRYDDFTGGFGHEVIGYSEKDFEKFAKKST